MIKPALLAWWKLTRGALWKLLLLSVGAHAFFDIARSRSQPSILFSYATFDPHSGWTRIIIVNCCSQTAIKNPVVGNGLKLWPKPEWVPTSVNNFWLVFAMHYGLVGLAVFLWRVSRRK